MPTTWKVWTSTHDDPVFEADKAEARAYIVEKLPDSRDATLESPDGYSYALQDGVWTDLDNGGVWTSDEAAARF